MINQKYTRLFLTEHRKVETAALLLDEGQALVNVKEGQETVVRPSTGANGEIFAGISLMRNSPPTVLNWVGEGVIPSSGSIELPRTPRNGQILIKVGGEVRTIVAGAPAEDQAQLTGPTITFFADDVAAGSAYTVQMAYDASLQEARQLLGDQPIGGLAALSQDVVGVITRGEVGTSFYDASADFAGAIQVRLGADGKFTTNGQGTLLPNVTVITAPSAENSALVLRVNV